MCNLNYVSSATAYVALINGVAWMLGSAALRGMGCCIYLDPVRLFRAANGCSSHIYDPSPHVDSPPATHKTARSEISAVSWQGSSHFEVAGVTAGHQALDQTVAMSSHRHIPVQLTRIDPTPAWVNVSDVSVLQWQWR